MTRHGWSREKEREHLIREGLLKDPNAPKPDRSWIGPVLLMAPIWLPVLGLLVWWLWNHIPHLVICQPWLSSHVQQSDHLSHEDRTIRERKVPLRTFDHLVVPPAGVEPATWWVEATRSIQLSYGGNTKDPLTRNPSLTTIGLLGHERVR